MLSSLSNDGSLIRLKRSSQVAEVAISQEDERKQKVEGSDQDRRVSLPPSYQPGIHSFSNAFQFEPGRHLNKYNSADLQFDMTFVSLDRPSLRPQASWSMYRHASASQVDALRSHNPSTAMTILPGKDLGIRDHSTLLDIPSNVSTSSLEHGSGASSPRSRWSSVSSIHDARHVEASVSTSPFAKSTTRSEGNSPIKSCQLREETGYLRQADGPSRIWGELLQGPESLGEQPPSSVISVPADLGDGSNDEPPRGRLSQPVENIEVHPDSASIPSSHPVAQKQLATSCRPSHVLIVSDPTSNSRGGARLAETMYRELEHGRTVSFDENVTFLGEMSRRTCIAVKPTFRFPNSEDGLEHTLNLRPEIPKGPPRILEENVALNIMRNLDNPRDLSSVVALSTGSFKAFQNNEKELVMTVASNKSPAAMEFLSSSESLTLVAFQDYQATVNAIAAALIIELAEKDVPSCHGSLVPAITAQSIQQMENALWRISTFCHIFGPNCLESNEEMAQIDWLNGGLSARKRGASSTFGTGNGKGLSKSELQDISDVWDCLRLMLDGQERRSEKAGFAGILEQCEIGPERTMQWYVDEWKWYILALGPGAVLAASSASFDVAKDRGFTSWTPPAQGKTRSSFLRHAITVAYQQRVLAEATTRAALLELPQRASHRQSKSDSELASMKQKLQQPLGQRLETLRLQPKSTSVKRKPVPLRVLTEGLQGPASRQSHGHSTSETVAMDNSAHGLAVPTKIAPIYQTETHSSNRNSTLIHSLAIAPTASSMLGATLFPRTNQEMNFETPSIPAAAFSASRPVTMPARPAPPADEPVIDPVDKAMALLVNEMGFFPEDASRALARSDTGLGIDLQAAIEMLASESSRKRATAPVELPARRPSSSKSTAVSNTLPESIARGKLEHILNVATTAHGRSQHRRTPSGASTVSAETVLGDSEIYAQALRNQSLSVSRKLGRSVTRTVSKVMAKREAAARERASRKASKVLGIDVEVVLRGQTELAAKRRGGKGVVFTEEGRWRAVAAVEGDDDLNDHEEGSESPSGSGCAEREGPLTTDELDTILREQQDVRRLTLKRKASTKPKSRGTQMHVVGNNDNHNKSGIIEEETQDQVWSLTEEHKHKHKDSKDKDKDNDWRDKRDNGHDHQSRTYIAPWESLAVSTVTTTCFAGSSGGRPGKSNVAMVFEGKRSTPASSLSVGRPRADTGRRKG